MRRLLDPDRSLPRDLDRMARDYARSAVWHSDQHVEAYADLLFRHAHEDSGSVALALRTRVQFAIYMANEIGWTL
ncbi:hypothetical protein LAZ40_16285 [Cereibacter sphaeroides]|uniref:hypothetical protein n=1 Tax=Cereibacter sphaeroides TaxID=1063 RepID=UPI001F2A8098|nr:hypothetical protein [Cereibacter sphaeroides]MCE6960584.1 hypothetical protein [Cereibacter sphaeroides]MCE6972735.1 hypothetical protein [Cereibacter sphaeroides]